MRGNWITTFAAGGVIVVLTLFFGLQYHWLSQASDAERERMQRRVESDTAAFADDLDREIQSAYFYFQIGPEVWRNHDLTEFNQRLEYWRSRAQYPTLIRGFIFVPKSGPVERYDADAKAFVPGDLPHELESVRGHLDSARAVFLDEPTVLVMPVNYAQWQMRKVVLKSSAGNVLTTSSSTDNTESIDAPEHFGSLLILLDRDVITTSILPDLAAKHFPDGNFRIAVTNTSGQPVYEPAGEANTPDAKSGLLGLSPDKMIFFAKGWPVPRVADEPSSGVVVSRRVESSTLSRTETEPDGSKTSEVTVHVQPTKELRIVSGVRARTPLMGDPGSSEPWSLSVQHTSGSIGTFVNGEFRRNLVVGAGLYLLLVAAIVAIVLSAIRSKRFAQRQVDFVSSVSHEFRTPLAVIYSAGENLADGVAHESDQVERYGDLIKGEGQKLSAMVEQILQFAGANSGKRKYNFALANPSDLVARALNECMPMLKEKGFEVETAIDDALPSVAADAGAISTALQNLINNAAKYSNASRWVRIRASNGSGSVKLSVEDRGIGISGRDLRQIFQPFFRSKEVIEAQIHGNGLGLALVKEIAAAHGGSVRARSEHGKGSEFVIELPVS